MEARAVTRYVRMSPQKARLVVDMIRGQKVESALNTLDYTPKKAARIGPPPASSSRVAASRSTSSTPTRE